MRLHRLLRLHRVVIAVSGAALATALSAGAAHADRSRRDTGPTPVGASGTAHHGNVVRPVYDAPTANLTAVANATQVHAKSVTAVVTVPAGLPVTNPVEVSVVFGADGPGRRVTQDYLPSAGLRLPFQFPEASAAKRSETILVNLTERTPTGAVPFHFRQSLTIEPLYDVTFSPLSFVLLGDCSVIGNEHPDIAWKNRAGDQYSGPLDAETGEPKQISAFAQQYIETPQAGGPPKPGIVWTGFPTDGVFSGGFHGPAPPRDDGPLLPDTVAGGASRTVQFTALAANDSSCLAEFKYHQTIQLRTYPQL